MKYDNFRELVDKIPLITTQYLHLLDIDYQILKNQLVYWQKIKKIIKLKRGIYILNDKDRKFTPSRMYIAYEMYKPSYISLEYALSFYGLIPEKVTDITCISSKKTSTFSNIFGTFRYQTVKENAFQGFIQEKDENNLSYYIANTEKAFLDFLYFNLALFKKEPKKVLYESFRFQNIEILKKEKLLEYASIFKNKKLDKIIKEVFYV